MCNISHSSGQNSGNEISSQSGDSTNSFAGTTIYQELISQANTVPLTRIFKYYRLKIDSTNYVSICPFKHHKNGRESSGSFRYYADSNTFCCYGCKTGGKKARGCEFMAAMEGITRTAAAIKILDLFKSDVDESIEFISEENFSERLKIMLDFSSFIRNFIQNNNNEKSVIYIEKLCKIYDDMYLKHTDSKRSLSNESLKLLISEIKNQI